MAHDRRRRRPVRIGRQSGLRPTPERLARAAGDVEAADVEVGGVSQRVRRMVDSGPLERFHRRGVVSDRQHGAGMRFWSDWFHAGMMQRTTSAYSDAPWPQGDRTGMAATERQVLARQRLRSARAALGSHLGRVVEVILIDELDPADAGRKLFGRRDVPQARASATDALKIALDTLADHYGL